MNTKRSVVLFDLDGTLLNTLADLREAVNYALREYGYPLKSMEEIRMSVGNGVGKLMERVLPDGKETSCYEQCLHTFRTYYSEHMQDFTRPYPGVCELLTALKKKGFRLGIVSNKFDAAVKALSRDYFGDLIDVAIGESPEVRKKPAPDCVLEAIRLLGAVKEEVLYVGDSDVDVATAHNEGIPCIGAVWGFRGRSVLLKAGADELIGNPIELLQLLENEKQ